MPLKSKAQERFLWAKHPSIAKEFEEATPTNAKLPEHVKMAEGGEVDDDASENWERIKDFVGGANKEPKHPLVQEAERMKLRKPQHLDDGGIAGADPALLGGLTPGDSTQMPLNVPRGTMPTAQPPVSPVQAPIASAAVAPPISAPPVSVPVNTEKPYNDKANSVLGGISPEALQAFMDNVIQNNKKPQIGAAIAGIGDAISSVGGGKPGHMQAAEEGIQRNKEMALKLPEQMAAMGKERYAISKELQAEDPSSPYSKISQRTYGPDLQQMGLTGAEVSRMPASLISDLFGKKVTLEEAKARIAQEGQYQKGMLENTKAVTQQNAAKELEGRGMIKTAADTIGDIIGTKASKAREVLAKQAAGQPSAPAFTPDVTSYAQKHGITPEQAQQIKLKRTGGQ